MKLSKNIRYLVRVRDYETVQVEVGAEADHHDLGLHDEDLAHNPDYIDRLELLVISEVEKLARYELEIIATWSEISPNLAEDFLSEPTIASLQKDNHARTPKTDPPPTSRRVRRGSSRTPSPPAA